MSPRTDELFLSDIYDCCDKIAKYVAGKSEAVFKTDEMLQDALVRNIEIIGEAAKSVSLELREANPQIVWREIMRMRDKIVHHYFKLDLDVIWNTVQADIPLLKTQVENTLVQIQSLSETEE